MPVPSSTGKPFPPSAATRRIRPGTKSRNVIAGTPVTSLAELDSAFQLQEHLASLLSSITNPPDSDQTLPLSRADCTRLATPPEGVEETLWCYELTRRLTRDLNVLIVALLNDGCTAATCPEMRASEWQYLCAVHDSPQSCCAIDYSTHTLDHAATMLTSTKFFPSRLSLQHNSVKHLASIFRRLYRIFAHAWFQHRPVFWEVEGEYGLYLFFKTVSDRYRLIPQDSLMLPPEAEGLKPGKNGELLAGDEDEEEEEFEEWDRGTGARGHLEPVDGGEEKEDSDEEIEGEYSDESDSDEEMVEGEDDDGDIIEDDDEIQDEEQEGMEEVKVLLERDAANKEAPPAKGTELSVEPEKVGQKEVPVNEDEKEKNEEKGEGDEPKGDDRSEPKSTAGPENDKSPAAPTVASDETTKNHAEASLDAAAREDDNVVPESKPEVEEDVTEEEEKKDK